MSGDPRIAHGGNGHVPWNLYLEDRRETRAALEAIQADIRALRDTDTRQAGVSHWWKVVLAGAAALATIGATVTSLILALHGHP